MDHLKIYKKNQTKKVVMHRKKVPRGNTTNMYDPLDRKNPLSCGDPVWLGPGGGEFLKLMTW